MQHLRRLNVLAAVMPCLLAVAGCTAIPVGPFQAYADVFGQVRTAGETVLLDYDLARAEAATMLESARAEARDDPESLERFGFDVASIVDEDESLDAVGVRLRAWETLARYNDALAAVADGRDVQRIAATVDGLYESLSTFPLEAMADLAADVTPFAGAARVAAQAVQREMDARRFAAAVRAARPAIDQFLQLLEDDAQNFYNVRLGLHNVHVDDLADRMADRARTFITLTGDLRIPPPEDDDARGRSFHSLLERVNSTLASMPDWPEDGLLFVPDQPGAGAALSAAALAQLEALADEIDELAAASVAADERLLSYREAMVRYVRLIRQTRRSIAMLTDALDRPRAAGAVASEALELAVSLRRAIHAYQNAGQ